MITFTETVATSNATANIAYCLFIICAFIAGGVLIYLLWDKIQTPVVTKTKSRPAKVAKKAVRKPAAKAVAKKPVAKKPARPVRKPAKKK